MRASSVKKELSTLADPSKARVLSSFFKTGPGQYGEGDTFFGITVPVMRAVARRFKDISLEEVEKLLNDHTHECRSAAVEILAMKFEAAFKAGDEARCMEIVHFYLAHTARINNWDLVDGSAPYILGCYLYEYKKSRSILYKLVKSKSLWERRIAIVSTQYFIGKKDFADVLRISESLLDDTHDLIHKAVGWMLREMGKRDEKPLVSFLEKHAADMPRTMLRYALERLRPAQRERYMAR